MNMKLWYCLKCDKSTSNWRTCQTCGTPAIYQRFVLIPVDESGKVQKEKLMPSLFDYLETVKAQ